MKNNIPARIDALRKKLSDSGIDAIIIPSTDPHLSEYVAPHWAARQWVSGFTGSAGTVVVTAKKAGLWSDSRYFLQAAEQLSGTGIDLYKEGLPETPTIIEFLLKELYQGARVGINGEVFAATIAQQIEAELHKNGIQLAANFNPLPAIWKDCPPIPMTPPYIYKEEYAGKSCKDKLEDIRAALQQKGCEALFISALDEIAWTLNLRGNDVKCNPVFIGYLLISKNDATLFIAPEKLTAEVSDYLATQGVSVAKYDEYTR